MSEAKPELKEAVRVRVIGVGNPDRGDDAAGLLVARRLKRPGVDALEWSGEALSLIDAWEGCDHVILVDAVVTGGRAGEIHCWDGLVERLPRESFRCSTHVFGVADAVELARIFDRLPSRLTVYGIEGVCFTPGSNPGPEVLEAVEILAGKILLEVSRCTTASV